MAARLQDDLIQEFREEKKMITAQIDLFNPMALSLRKPAAQRLANKGMIIFAEVLCWLSLLGCIAFGIFLNKLYPFYILFQLKRVEISKTLGAINVQNLLWCVYGMIGVVVLLLFFLARTLAKIRKKNDVLSIAGKNIKTVVGQHLTRKAAIDAIEQRHFLELPQVKATDINDIPNPGYDGGSVQRFV